MADLDRAIAAYRASNARYQESATNENARAAADDAADLLAAIDAAQGEAVAWRVDWPNESELGFTLSESPVADARNLPLFAAPPAAAVQWDIREAVELLKSGAPVVEVWEKTGIYSDGLCAIRDAIAPPASAPPLSPDVLLDMAEPLRPLLHTPEHWRMVREYGGAVAAAALKQAPPAALAVPADYALGETIYTPPSEEVRFCYSRGQPNNINASRLGEACRRAAEKPGGDYIDGGLSLLKELEARGYGVFRFAKSAHEQAQQPAAAVPEAMTMEQAYMRGFSLEKMRGWNDCRAAMLAAAERKGE